MVRQRRIKGREATFKMREPDYQIRMGWTKTENEVKIEENLLGMEVEIKFLKLIHIKTIIWASQLQAETNVILYLKTIEVSTTRRA